MITDKRTHQDITGIPKGDSLTLNFTIKDVDGNLIPKDTIEDASNIRLRAWRIPDHFEIDKNLSDFTIVEDGLIKVSLTEVDTDSLKRGYYQYDVYFDSPYNKYVVTNSQIEVTISSYTKP